MDRALQKLSKHVGQKPEALAVTVASKISPFASLVSTVLSLRTRDEVTAVVTPRTLGEASTPQEMASLSVAKIAELIYPTSFYRMKAQYLLDIAKSILTDHDGNVPDTMEGLLSLKGIGRKSANLILTLGFGKPGICVDTHVHRLSNRLGFVKTSSPLQTEMVLRAVLPKRWWIDVNGILMAFGRTHCKPVSPHCTTCPIMKTCPKEGVTLYR